MAKETGEFDIACAQHCGVHHYKMKGQITVLPPDEYDAWFIEASENAKVGHDADDASGHWGWDWEANRR
jgi:cytochrome c oxidase subunit 2